MEAQALNLLQERGGQIHLMLLDVTMSNVNGYQVLEQMKEQGWLERIPVVMLVGENRMDQVERAYRMGADDHIQAPFNGRIIRPACGMQFDAVCPGEGVELHSSLAKNGLRLPLTALCACWKRNGQNTVFLRLCPGNPV